MLDGDGRGTLEETWRILGEALKSTGEVELKTLRKALTMEVYPSGHSGRGLRSKACPSEYPRRRLGPEAYQIK